MELEIKKKKVVWSIVISVLGSTLFWYLTSMGAIFDIDKEVIGGVDALSSINPLGTGVSYLLLFMVAMPQDHQMLFNLMILKILRQWMT